MIYTSLFGSIYKPVRLKQMVNPLSTYYSITVLGRESDLHSCLILRLVWHATAEFIAAVADLSTMNSGCGIPRLTMVLGDNLEMQFAVRCRRQGWLLLPGFRGWGRKMGTL